MTNNTEHATWTVSATSCITYTRDTVTFKAAWSLKPTGNTNVATEAPTDTQLEEVRGEIDLLHQSEVQNSAFYVEKKFIRSDNPEESKRLWEAQVSQDFLRSFAKTEIPGLTVVVVEEDQALLDLVAAEADAENNRYFEQTHSLK
ncbi:hypothetical protein M231_06613 [Tremella mesenterica]|uniref:Uncharacterized protein n=1 Tax=Tremella mesenterica TaxID=5217 RepID=A0A4Q1BBD4_TREME|nr:uncharacterized protein TREMEDRAFT_58589 [Tremella mesenterica DSM 1558]EIW72427.1 hypothetical protein TREMEDRAFT_58589 [Tremella mesenterica DSM 1558]RXK36122.1 hypothetical protein M231_06613 [Tremella mesenterica]